jgi:uncharacterized protein (DUF608 family)
VQTSAQHAFNGIYEGQHLDRIAFPMGGIGAGMVSLSGTGTICQVSISGVPEIHNEPYMMSAIYIQGQDEPARVLEGPVPDWKYSSSSGPGHLGSGNGGPLKTYGLPRFSKAQFKARFPFAEISLTDEALPIEVRLTGWSPFVPGDEDASSLPVAGLEYTFRNRTNQALKLVYSYHATALLSAEDLAILVAPRNPPPFRVEAIQNGILILRNGGEQEPWRERAFCAVVDEFETHCDYAWFRGDNPLDPMLRNWQNISRGLSPENPPVSEGLPSTGGSIYVPFELGPGEEKNIRLKLAWYVPITKMRAVTSTANGTSPAPPTDCSCKSFHKPWYAGVFSSISDVLAHWRTNYDSLKQASKSFTDTFFGTTLSPEVLEAVAANLSILKSPTVLRQTDGRLWAYEGCFDEAGCCAGSCTHVWNYAQAVPHLFPALERSLRKTEFNEAQAENGHQQYRVNLPISPTAHDFHSAADGQLGGIMKVYREWRVSGDTDWLEELWAKVVQSLNYCIETWDPRRIGALEEPHHNTYDVEFWGPDSLTSSFYLGALKAACLMGAVLGKNTSAYRELYEKGRVYLETELWNGEYFIQRTRWKDLNTSFPPTQQSLWTSRYQSPETKQVLEQEGPKYQYGQGCLSDGVLGAWMAEVCGIGEIIDPQKVEQHLLSVYKYNYKKSLADNANPIRSTYASGKEGGLLLCTWPKGSQPSFPFLYSFEVWTGIEYQVASHLSMLGHVQKGLEIIRTCRSRYDGRVRNPFDEIECGHWYARAMSSYGLLQGLTGARYDAVEKTLYLDPAIDGDFQSFLCAESGYGWVGIRDGRPFLTVRKGVIDVEKFVLRTKNGESREISAL